jgi:hypothetical protein
MTKAQQLRIKDFPYEEKDERERTTYWENEFGYWIKIGYDLKGNKVYHENSNGYGYVWTFDENNKIITEIDIQTYKIYKRREIIINSLL